MRPTKIRDVIIIKKSLSLNGCRNCEIKIKIKKTNKRLNNTKITPARLWAIKGDVMQKNKRITHNQFKNLFLVSKQRKVDKKIDAKRAL
jgi:hypothetical protein